MRELHQAGEHLDLYHNMVIRPINAGLFERKKKKIISLIFNLIVCLLAVQQETE